MQQQHTGNVENSDRDLIYSLFELSLPFNISPTSASTDIDSMLPRASLPHSRSIYSDSMLGFVRKGHPSLDLYRSNQLLQRSEPRSTPKPSPPFDRDSLSTIPSLLSHSRSTSSDSKLDFVQQVHPSLDLPNTGASKNSDDREQQRVVSMPTDCKLDSSVGEPCEPTFFRLSVFSLSSSWRRDDDPETEVKVDDSRKGYHHLR